LPDLQASQFRETIGLQPAADNHKAPAPALPSSRDFDRVGAFANGNDFGAEL
jgi:hypothetical protein